MKKGAELAKKVWSRQPRGASRIPVGLRLAEHHHYSPHPNVQGADMTVDATVKGVQFAADGTLLVANKTVEAGQKGILLAADGTMFVVNTTVQAGQVRMCTPHHNLLGRAGFNPPSRP